METKKSKNMLLVRLETGEEIISSLEKACEENKIKGGFVFGIGALSYAKIVSAGSRERIAFEFSEINGPIEIASAMGNVSQKEGKTFVHLHASLGLLEESGSGKKGITTYATHISKGIISLTGEFFVFPCGKLERKLNEKTNMFVWDLR